MEREGDREKGSVVDDKGDLKLIRFKTFSLIRGYFLIICRKNYKTGDDLLNVFLDTEIFLRSILK